MPPHPAVHDRTSTSDAVAWSVFLACSWTWCIGMILPTLMLRDAGLTGFLIFLVPNVIGAGAMGWVFRRNEQSHRFVAQHELACRLFSWITILFHGFALMWLATLLPVVSIVIASVIVLAVHLLMFSQGSCMRRAGFVVLSASVVLAILFFLRQPISEVTSITNNVASHDFSMLALVCIFGFALCPYLDLTFHRVRQSTSPTGSRLAFTLGFGVFFLLMMAFSVIYASWLRDLISPTQETTRSQSTIAPTLFATHFGLQAWFTVRAHMRELTQSSTTTQSRDRSHTQTWCVLIIAIGAIVVAAQRVYPHGVFQLSAGEIGYRVILGFYGLVFPAYIVLVALPSRYAQSTRWTLLAAALVLASGFFFAGFILREHWWLAPGLAVIAAARLLLPVLDRILQPSTEDQSDSLVL